MHVVSYNIPVIDSIYCLITFFSLFGSLTFIIILRGFFEQLKHQIGLDMANSDASSSTTCTVRVLVSFYLAATDDSSGARTSPIHKEKFNVTRSGDERKDLFNFVRHLKAFTGLVEIAKSKGLGENGPRSRLPESKRQEVASRRFHSELKMPGNMSLTLLSGETGCSKVLVTM